MRSEAKQLISDIALDEAQNDDIVELCTSLKVKAAGESSREYHEVRVGPALAYMLIDTLEMGVNVPHGTKQVVHLVVELPEGWGQDDHIMSGPNFEVTS